jgi:hypothetical protein
LISEVVGEVDSIYPNVLFKEVIAKVCFGVKEETGYLCVTIHIEDESPVDKHAIIGSIGDLVIETGMVETMRYIDRIGFNSITDLDGFPGMDDLCAVFHDKMAIDAVLPKILIHQTQAIVGIVPHGGCVVDIGKAISPKVVIATNASEDGEVALIGTDAEDLAELCVVDIKETIDGGKEIKIVPFGERFQGFDETGKVVLITDDTPGEADAEIGSTWHSLKDALVKNIDRSLALRVIYGSLLVMNILKKIMEES